MKLVFIIAMTSIFTMPFEWRHSNISFGIDTAPNLHHAKQADDDSSQSIRILNASSLKRLPAVVRDLSAALKESVFQERFLSGKNRLEICVYDGYCNSSAHSAYVLYQTGDSIYRVKLNRLNKWATDRALAATLIHEIMHCVLLDIYSRAKRGEENAVASVISFGLNKNDSSGFFNNEFFALMNSGDDGQHELIHRLFYPQMVSLLESFARIHEGTSFHHRDAALLMWSGLQKTSAYKNLGEEEKREIEQTILSEKGINIEQN